MPFDQHPGRRRMLDPVDPTADCEDVHVGKSRYAFRLLGEFARFAREKRVYWIVPLVLLLGLAALLIVAGQVSSPLIYTLF